MRSLLNRALLAPMLLSLGLSAQAAEWVLDPADSKVIFEYSYGGEPWQGAFSNVEANFNIDPLDPGNCEFLVTIHIEDIEIDSPEALDYLLDYELFDVDQFPVATFQAESCRLTGATSYESDGTLTIRDQTHPLTFPFELDVDIDGGLRFHLTSEVTIERLKYGVGQGYWASTAEIPNDVKVIVDVYATRQ